MAAFIAAIIAWLGKYFIASVLPAVMGWLARHLQEVVKDWLQARQTQKAVQESKDAKTPEEKDKATKDMANNY